MARTGVIRKIPFLEMLAGEHLERLHEATLQVLWQPGVRFESEWALDFLAANGCKVDRETRQVCFPRDVVEACLARAPRSFVVKAPKPENDLLLGGDGIYFTHSSGMETVDLRTFEPRKATLKEYVDCVRVLDALETVDLLGAYPFFGYEGVSPAMAIPEGVALKMRYSGKHQMEGCSNDNEIFTIQMAQATGQEITGIVGYSAPLMWGREAIDGARRIVEAGFHLTTVDGCIRGGSAPVTIAGEIVVSNAAHLSMIVLTQLLRPGHRISVGHFSLPMNMSTGAPAFGQIDSSISNVIFNQVWRWYGIPFSNGSPGYVNAKIMDFQAGYEKMAAAMLAALSGAGFILLHLGVSGEITAHPLQAILDEDVAGMIGRFLAGEEVSDDTLALALIEEVGPLPGHYMDKRHTIKWWRKEQYVPKSADRLSYSQWLSGERKVALDYARERMASILSEEPQSRLTDSQEEDLRRILAEARAFFAKREA